LLPLFIDQYESYKKNSANSKIPPNDLKATTKNIELCCSDISLLLLDITMIFMDLFILGKIFKSNSDAKNIVIYAGDLHITTYRKFLDNIGGTVLFSQDAKSYKNNISGSKIYDSENKEYIDNSTAFDEDTAKRCITIPPNIMELILKPLP
jgi:hypothetical protein